MMGEYAIRVTKDIAPAGYPTSAWVGKPTPMPREGEEIELDVRDIERQEWIRVRAIVSRSFEALPGADKLWLYDWWGTEELLEKEPWAIKVLEVLEEEVEEVKVTRAQPSLGKMRGHMLEHLIREREQKEQAGGR